MTVTRTPSCAETSLAMRHIRRGGVHDSLPENQQSFCLLSTMAKAGLEYNWRKVESVNFFDQHWNRNMTDPK
ncbi:hypothetical protein BHE74_00058423 [Ensete ventricosum]|nr:hypothetical protein BHE74_00058423 [Ensete ventricosum]